MDARETWQALQARLTTARAAVEAGDRPRALAEIAAALDIDPDFLAAHALRERILVEPDVVPASAVFSSGSAPSSDGVGVADPRDGYARFEQRARQRRVDRRLEAARAALEGGHLEAAATALDEVSELDPTAPELPQLTMTVDELRRKATAHHGPRFFAAAVFAVTVLAASMLHDSRSLISPPMIAAAPRAATSTPTPSIPSEIAVAETVSSVEPMREPALPLVLEPANAVSADEPSAALPPAEPEIVQPPPPVVVPVPRPAVDAATEASLSMPLPSPVASLSMPSPPLAPPPPDDDQLIKQALERYRTAYEGLDAQSAHAVWPTVDQAALARAFEGIESQSFTFDSCDVRVRAESASATCEGMTRYIPKIGSREPRTEPRVWNFSLNKAGGVWKIESARAER